MTNLEQLGNQMIPESSRFSLACAMRHYREAPLSAIIAIRESNPEDRDPLKEKGSAYFRDQSGRVFSFDLSLHAIGKRLDLADTPDASRLDLIRNQRFYQHLTHVCVAITSAYEHCPTETDAERIVVVPASLPIMAMKAILSDAPSPFRTEQSQAAVVAMSGEVRDFLRGLNYPDIKRTQITLISEALPKQEPGVLSGILKLGLERWEDLTF